MSATPTPGALRAAAILFEHAPDYQKRAAQIIDSETRLPEYRYVLTQILTDLPTKRDWLDPDLEKRARELLT